MPKRLNLPDVRDGPTQAGDTDMKQLTEAGVSLDEMLDLVLTASLFGWANRLMHVLGDPIPTD